MSKHKPTSPLAYYCAFWIDRLCAAAVLPRTTANALVRTAIHAAPPLARPTPVEGWMFEQATDHADILNCEDFICWLRMRVLAGDEAGTIELDQGQYWYQRLDEPPRFATTRWQRWCRTVAQEADRKGFALKPRLLTAFSQHPTEINAYLRVATFKALLVAEQEAITDLPPPPLSDFPSVRVSSVGPTAPLLKPSTPAFPAPFPANVETRLRAGRITQRL